MSIYNPNSTICGHNDASFGRQARGRVGFEPEYSLSESVRREGRAFKSSLTDSMSSSKGGVLWSVREVKLTQRCSRRKDSFGRLACWVVVIVGSTQSASNFVSPGQPSSRGPIMYPRLRPQGR